MRDQRDLEAVTRQLEGRVTPEGAQKYRDGAAARSPSRAGRGRSSTAARRSEPYGLQGRDLFVERITRNVLDRFSSWGRRTWRDAAPPDTGFRRPHVARGRRTRAGEARLGRGSARDGPLPPGVLPGSAHEPHGPRIRGGAVCLLPRPSRRHQPRGNGPVRGALLGLCVGGAPGIYGEFRIAAVRRFAGTWLRRMLTDRLVRRFVLARAAPLWRPIGARPRTGRRRPRAVAGRSSRSLRSLPTRAEPGG